MEDEEEAKRLKESVRQALQRQAQQKSQHPTNAAGAKQRVSVASRRPLVASAPAPIKAPEAAAGTSSGGGGANFKAPMNFDEIMEKKRRKKKQPAPVSPVEDVAGPSIDNTGGGVAAEEMASDGESRNQGLLDSSSPSPLSPNQIPLPTFTEDALVKLLEDRTNYVLELVGTLK